MLLKKLFLISTLSLLLFVTSGAQDLYVILTYSASIPTADTKEFIEKPGFIGFGLDVHKLIQRDISVGFYTGWNAFEKQTDQPIKINDEIVDTTQNRLINAFPVFFTTHYYIGDNEKFIPFVGLGLGAVYFFHHVEFGGERLESNRWRIAFAPEAGFVYLLSSVYAFINVKYDFAFSGKNQITNQSNPESYLEIAFTPMGNF